MKARDKVKQLLQQEFSSQPRNAAQRFLQNGDGHLCAADLHDPYAVLFELPGKSNLSRKRCKCKRNQGFLNLLCSKQTLFTVKPFFTWSWLLTQEPVLAGTKSVGKNSSKLDKASFINISLLA
eukprot:m.150666 g.150666  ORF g.150666 m.150666 type:complete len:123 (-) comp24476_c0_seq1:110-478(-)